SGGVALFLWLRAQQRKGRLQQVPLIERWNGRRLFESILVALTRLARRALRGLTTRRLQMQMFAIVATTILLAYLAAADVPLTWGDRERITASNAFVLFWIVGIVCAVGAAAMAKFH